MSQDIEDMLTCGELGVGCGVSHDMEDSAAGTCRDVESAACHQCCHYREAPGPRGGPQLRGRPVLGLPTARTLRAEGESAFEPRPRRPRTSPGAISDHAVELIIGLRKELTGQGLDAGPHTICWHLRHHHQITVSPATVSRYLTRHGLVTRDPAKRPRSSCLRFAAEQPNECWQSDFTRYRLASGTDTEIVCWLDDHSRYVLHLTAHARVTGSIVVAAFRAAVAAYGVPVSTLTDNGLACTTRFSGGRGRNGLEHELRRLGVRQKTASRTTRRPRAKSSGSSRR